MEIGEANVGRKGDVGKDLYVKYLDKTMKGTDVYGNLKRTLVNKIVSQRIYQVEQLNKLFSETASKHRGLDQKKLRTMWAEIMNDLNA